MLQIEFEKTAEERAAADVEGRAGYVQRLAAVLGDGGDWEYRGENHDNGAPVGRCACGHQGIRFEFKLHNVIDGRTATVGSTCVETFPGISEAAADAIMADAEKLRQAAAERVRQARLNAQDLRVQALMRDLDAAAWELDRIIRDLWERRMIWTYGSSRPLARFVYDRRHGAERRLQERQEGQPHPHARIKVYKSKAAMIKKIEAKLQEYRAAISRPFES